MTNRTALLAAAMLVLATPDPSAAQEFAIKGGAAISSFGPDAPGTYDGSLVATSFGGHYRRNFGRFALQPEVNMISKGAVSADETERIRLEYIEVPVLLVVPVKFGAVEVYGFAGPYLGLESRCRYTLEEEGLKTNSGCEFVEPSFDHRGLDWGVAGGAGVGHPFLGGRILLEGRYAHGLRNIHDDSPELDVRNRSVVINLGYTLDLNLSNEGR